MAFVLLFLIGGVISKPGRGREFRSDASQLIDVVIIVIQYFQEAVIKTTVIVFNYREYKGLDIPY
jgi:hypothetical protein